MNRRDIIKLFGVGATIVPVIGGVPEIAAPAKLIVEPTIEPVVLAKASEISPFTNVIIGDNKVNVTVDLVQNGSHYRFQADSFIVEFSRQVVNHDLGNGHALLSQWGTNWTLRGIGTGPADILKELDCRVKNA